MIKGAFVFAAGLAVGTAYGFGYGIRLSKAIAAVAESEAQKKTTVVSGEVDPETSAA